MDRRILIRNLVLACLPLAAGLALDLSWQFGFPPVPLLNVLVDAGTLLLLGCAVLSLALAALVLAWHAGQVRQEQALDALRQSQDEAHRRFLRRLDHEVKNPLTGIRAALANLVDPPAGGRKSSESLEDIQHQVDRLSRLVNDLRKLAELEERPLEHLKVDPAQLLEEVVETVRANPVYGQRDLRLVITQVPWSLPSVTGDRDLLGLAFYNLLDNAMKYTCSSDSIEVRAFEDGRSLTVEVADTGPGIAPDDLPRLFEELYRGANARGSEGSGLGLALVHRIFTRHGGEVSVRSRPLKSAGEQTAGCGTVFTVHLPLS